MRNEIQECILKNGLKVLIKPDHRAPIAIFEIFYKVGSSYEHGGITGVSHALEHMMFRGSRKYSPEKYLKIISESGGEQNAFTSHDCTSYYEMMNVDHLEFCFQFEADRMHNLLLREKDFVKEMQVIIEERRMSIEDNPKRRTLERFYAAAYLSGPYHHSILGWMDDLQNMTLSDLQKWYETWYAPNNAIAVIVGDVVPSQVKQLAKKYFGRIKPAKIPTLKPRNEQTPLGMRTVTVKAPAKLPWIVMGFNTPVVNTAAFQWEPYALVILGEILAGGDNSRLDKNLVRGSQILMEVNYHYSPFDRCNNIFALYITPASDANPDAIYESVFNEIKTLQMTPPTTKELDRVKAQIIADRVYQDDSIASQALELGGFESVGITWREINDIYKALAKITPAQVQKVCEKFLIKDHLTLANLEPIQFAEVGTSSFQPSHSEPEKVR